MRIVHSADVHLRTDNDERLSALVAVVASATQAGAQVLAIAGDLFDRDVDAPLLKESARRCFEGFPGTVLIIPGNHDTRGVLAGDFFGANARVFAGHDVVADVDGVRFVGVPFEDVSADATLSRLRAASQLRAAGVNVLLYHGELLDLVPGGGAFGEEDDRDYMPARLSDLGALGFDYVLAGHFHSNHDVRTCGTGYFVYSGSPSPVTRRETGRRHVTVIDTGNAPVALPLDTPYYEAIDIRLSPGDGAHPLARIERELAALPAHARALLTVRGFVDVSTAGTSESEFHASLKELCARFPCELDAAGCSDVGAIVSGDLFRRFCARLEQSPLDNEDRVLVREMAIRAMLEVPDAR